MLKGQNRRVMNYHLRRRGGPLLLGLIFLAGAAGGTQLLRYCSRDTLDLLEAFLELRQETTLKELFLNSLSTELLQLLLLFFCGFCAIGQPVSVFLLFYRGLGLGMTGTYLAQQGREAFLYYGIVLLPQTLLLLVIQIIATRESIGFSMSFLRQLFGGNRSTELPARIYILRFVILLILTTIAAGTGGLLTLLLSQWMT